MVMSHCIVNVLNAIELCFEMVEMINFVLCIFDHKNKDFNYNEGQLLCNYVELRFDVGFG